MLKPRTMLGKTIKGLFWTSAETPEPAPAAPAPVAPAPAAKPAVRAPLARGTGRVEAAPPTREYSALYARVGAGADPRVDQVLAAYEAMRGAIGGAELAIAIGATARALGLEPAAIAAALGERLGALEAAAADEDRKASTREAARLAELDTATTTAQAEIAALEQKAAALREQLATATAQIKDKNSKERAAVTALSHQLEAEAARLRAIREFFAAPR